jgi:predicted dehydrogenase
MSMRSGRRLRLGMVGGGRGAFIGEVHRMAARIDDECELVAGAFSADPDRARASGADLRLSPDRVYGDYAEMARAEAGRADGIEAVAIVTPNHLHAPIASAFAQAGIDVICDKPLAISSAQVRALAETVEKSGVILAVTYNYSAYPLIREARRLVADGALGEIRLVHAAYFQDWLTEPLEASGQKQASWRADPKLAGPGGCLGDIGTHAYHLACFVSGLSPLALSADLASLVPGRRLDDNAHVMLRYASGARGTIRASQTAPGKENALTLDIHGSKGGLSWAQENPNLLAFTPYGEPTRLLTRGGAGLSDGEASDTRIPVGHPEGYLEAFATLYREIARAIRARRAGEPSAMLPVPGIADGLDGVLFIEACLASARAGGAWTRLGADETSSPG